MVLGRSQKQIGVWQPTTKVARLGGQEARRTPRLGVEETGTGGRVPHTHGPDKSEGFQVARGATAGVGQLAEVVRWVVSKESLTYETGDLKTLDG